MIIDGKALAADVEAETRARVEKLAARCGVVPASPRFWWARIPCNVHPAEALACSVVLGRRM
jgi:hypothetical protein